MALDPFKNLVLTSDLLRLVGEIDEFKGAWKAFGTLAPERLATLKQIATVESVGASTRIEGAKLTDREVDILLSNLDLGSFRTRDEQEVAGYGEATKLVFDSWREIPFTENYIKQLHGILLKFSPRDEHHRGSYKTLVNNVEAFDAHGRSVGVIFETENGGELAADSVSHQEIQIDACVREGTSDGMTETGAVIAFDVHRRNAG